MTCLSIPFDVIINGFYCTFKFINGSLKDYALKKERLLLETEPDMTVQSRINHIVVGLPTQVQNLLDKEEITITEGLMSQLSKCSRFNNVGKTALISSPSFKYNKHPNDNNSPKQIEKRPCTICESIGKTGRFHSKEICRFKQTDNRCKQDSMLFNL